MDPEHVYAVVKVLAKLSRLNEGFDITIGSCNDSGIGMNRSITAQALERLFLNCPHKLGLQLRAQFGHRVHLSELRTVAVRRLHSGKLEGVVEWDPPRLILTDRCYDVPRLRVVLR